MGRSVQVYLELAPFIFLNLSTLCRGGMAKLHN